MRKGAVISLAALVLAAISCTDSFKSGTGNPVPSCLQKKIIHASDNAGRGGGRRILSTILRPKQCSGRVLRARSGALPQMTPSRSNLCSFCHIFKEFQANQRKSLPLRTEWVRLSFCGQKSVNDPQTLILRNYGRKQFYRLRKDILRIRTWWRRFNAPSQGQIHSQRRT